LVAVDFEIGRGRVRELQRFKAKASEVPEGQEFGSLIESKIEIAPGDRLESFKIIEK
jgi:translation initiation factor IF-2